MRKVMLTVVVLALSGCAVIPSRALRTDETIAAGRAREGYVVIAVSGGGWRPDTDLFGLSFCQDGELNRCIVLGPQSTSEGYRAYALPPGTWCATEAWVQNGDFYLDVAVDRAGYQCFPVVESTVSYPGHLEVHAEDSQFPGSARTSFAFMAVAGVHEQALAKYPALAAFEWATPVISPVDSPADE